MNHALLGAPEPPRTAHEWVDFTIEHAALQGPGGVALGALLSAERLDAPAEKTCLIYTSPSPPDKRQWRVASSA